MALGRAALERIEKLGGQPERMTAEDKGASSAGTAAMFLAISASSADRRLLFRVVRLRPHNMALWLSMARQGLPEGADAEFARVVLHEPDAPETARVGAAVALAPLDPEAKQFATKAVSHYLARFWQTDAELLLARGMQQPATPYRLYNPKDEPAEMVEFLSGMRFLSVLEFLQTKEAESLTFTYLDSANSAIRRTLGLVAAMRWPERFLGASFSDSEERNKLLVPSCISQRT